MLMFPWLDLVPNTLTQSILPGWSMVTVNESNSTAPDTENRIVAGDSYGRQIGRMMDVVDLLLTRARKDDPALADLEIVKDFDELKERIEKAKTAADVARQDRLINDLMALKERDEVQFNAVIRAVKT